MGDVFMTLVQSYLRRWRPRFLGWLTRQIYHASNVQIASDLRCDAVPRILIDPSAQLYIGPGVELRSGVEIRVHQKGQVRLLRNIRVDRGVRILAANEALIELEAGCRIGLYSVFNGGDSIRVGEGSLISGFVYLQTSMHGYRDPAKPVQAQGYQHAPVSLGPDCWLGTHVVVLPGVTLGRGTVVGSNAVVNRSCEEYAVLGGVPAKKIKSREG